MVKQTLIDKNTPIELSKYDEEFLNRVFENDVDVDFSDEQISLVDPPRYLQNTLYKIPQLEQRKTWRYRSARAIAATVLLVPALLVYQQFKQPSEDDIIRAKQELVIALAYLQSANQKADTQVRHILNTELKQAMIKPVFRRLAKKPSLHKEEL